MGDVYALQQLRNHLLITEEEMWNKTAEIGLEVRRMREGKWEDKEELDVLEKSDNSLCSQLSPVTSGSSIAARESCSLLMLELPCCSQHIEEQHSPSFHITITSIALSCPARNLMFPDTMVLAPETNQQMTSTEWNFLCKLFSAYCVFKPVSCTLNMLTPSGLEYSLLVPNSVF